MERDKYKLTDEQKIIFEQHKQAVKYVAYKNFFTLYTKGSKLEVENAGYLGLVYAIKTYDESKGANMLTWVITNVRYAILRYIQEQGFKGNKPIDCISIDAMEKYERTGKSFCPHDFTLCGEYTEANEEFWNTKQTIGLLNDMAKKVLTKQMYEVYKKLYSDGLSFSEVSRDLGVSKNRVSQLNKALVYKLQKECKENGLL